MHVSNYYFSICRSKNVILMVSIVYDPWIGLHSPSTPHVCLCCAFSKCLRKMFVAGESCQIVFLECCLFIDSTAANGVAVGGESCNSNRHRVCELHQQLLRHTTPQVQWDCGCSRREKPQMKNKTGGNHPYFLKIHRPHHNRPQ